MLVFLSLEFQSPEKQVKMKAGKIGKAHRNGEVKKSKYNSTRDTNWKNDNRNLLTPQKTNRTLQQNSDLLTRGMGNILCKRISLILRLGVTFVAGGNDGRNIGGSLLLLFLANQHKQPEA